MTRDENYFRRFSVGTVATSSIDNPRGSRGGNRQEVYRTSGVMHAVFRFFFVIF